jgi:hypothetical protein
MKKITGADPMVGPEPLWKDHEKNGEKEFLIKAFNWYGHCCDKKDAKEFVLEYMKSVGRDKDEIAAIRNVAESNFEVQFGWIARMMTAGFTPSQTTKEYFVRKYKALQTVKAKQIKQLPAQTVQVQPVNIQDRIRDKARDEIGDIEGIIDDCIANKFKNVPDIQNYLKSKNLSSVVLNKVCDWYIQKSAEISEVIESKDPQVKEGYSNFSKPNLRKFKELLDSIVSITNKTSIDNKPVRKIRKKKEKPASQIVSKMKYLSEDESLGIKSLPAEKIVGASQVWTYNVKTKVLGVYHAEDARGLSVKGSTLLNFKEDISIGKRLRKPKEAIDTLLAAGKVKLKQLLPSLSTKELTLTGRINSDTLIIRII